MNNKQYKELMRNYQELVDSDAISVRFVFHIDREGFYLGGITLDFTDALDVPDDFNPQGIC